MLIIDVRYLKADSSYLETSRIAYDEVYSLIVMHGWPRLKSYIFNVWQ